MPRRVGHGELERDPALGGGGRAKPRVRVSRVGLEYVVVSVGLGHLGNDMRIGPPLTSGGSASTCADVPCHVVT